jgi:hypothetical protein
MGGENGQVATRKKSCTRLHLEGDAKGVVDAVKNEAVDYSKLGHLVADIKMSLREFLQWKINFVGRESNSAAHSLAKLAVRTNVERICKEVLPDCIRDIVLLEQAALVG